MSGVTPQNDWGEDISEHPCYNILKRNKTVSQPGSRSGLPSTLGRPSEGPIQQKRAWGFIFPYIRTKSFFIFSSYPCKGGGGIRMLQSIARPNRPQYPHIWDRQPTVRLNAPPDPKCFGEV
jgi:hypothetical protein